MVDFEAVYDDEIPLDAQRHEKAARCELLIPNCVPVDFLHK
jgi:hypothetical protein